jgi:glutamate-5-semialdehyde dehydrogenase
MSQIRELAYNAKVASRALAAASGAARAQALNAMAGKLEAVKEELLAANAIDLENARKANVPEAFLKRLAITDKIFNYMTKRLKEAAALPDPVGKVLQGARMATGLEVTKVAVPLGVIGIIYEARPNVTTDAAAVALKSANAVILRGGSESINSNKVLVKAMQEAIVEAGLPANAVQYMDVPGHDAVSELLQQDDLIDVIIPRGGKSLIKAISNGTKIPVIKHYDGICHQYVSKNANFEMAIKLILNSKLERVEVCNALETLLVDQTVAKDFLPLMAEAFNKEGVEIRACNEALKYIPNAIKAVNEDWDTEYLDKIISIKVVKDIYDAADHIAMHGSGHTDGIITDNLNEAELFTKIVDSASVLINASTRLSGGGDYGMGAVVGISTGKLHARGPVGPEELCSYKWIAKGNGHLR